MSIQGFVKIVDKDTGEVLVDTHNDVLYGNMSVALAHALVGNPDSFLYYMAFGDGGAYDTLGVNYRQTMGELSGSAKNPVANLYNTLYVKKISNDATSSGSYNQLSRAYIPIENFSTDYEDITIDVIISASEPPTGVIQDAATNTIKFNEIGLFAGSDNLFAGAFTQTLGDVTNFQNQTPNFSNASGTKSKLMLTHVIFNPIIKVAIQSLEIIYTLRIQMGA
jgi:hypothetical protein